MGVQPRIRQNPRNAIFASNSQDRTLIVYCGSDNNVEVGRVMVSIKLRWHQASPSIKYAASSRPGWNFRYGQRMPSLPLLNARQEALHSPCAFVWAPAKVGIGRMNVVLGRWKQPFASKSHCPVLRCLGPVPVSRHPSAIPGEMPILRTRGGDSVL